MDIQIAEKLAKPELDKAFNSSIDMDLPFDFISDFSEKKEKIRSKQYKIMQNMKFIEKKIFFHNSHENRNQFHYQIAFQRCKN